MEKNARNPGVAQRIARGSLLLLTLSAWASAGCGEPSNGGGDAPSGEDATEVVEDASLEVGDVGIDTPDTPEPDMVGDLVVIADVDASSDGDSAPPDATTDGQTDLTDAVTEDAIDATADTSPDTTADTSADTAQDAGEVIEDTGPEPCEPGEPCDLEMAWDCVEGLCTSLGTCAPSPIAGCCIDDMDCGSVEPPGPCSTFSCVNNLCVAQSVPGCCASVADCSDGEACTLDQCPIPGALCIHCPAGCPCPESPPAFSVDFDEGTFVPGWIVSDDNLGDDVDWHVSGRRWVRPPYSAYLGDEECGTYSNAPMDGACEPVPLPGPGGTKITATMKTPTIPLLYSPAGHVALFWVWSEVEPLATGGPGEADVLTLEVEEALTQQSWPLTSTVEVGKNTGGEWALLGADLSPWLGKNVRLRFHFDSFQNLDNQHEGVYVDDIQVVPRCVGGCCASDADCGALPLEDGCSEARCVTLAGGAGNVCAAVPVNPGALCEPCSSDAHCVDDNPCTTDVCEPHGVCSHEIFCCFEESVFFDSFEEGLEPYYLGDSDPQDGVGWKVSGPAAVVGFQSAWLADPESGTYASSSPIDVSLTTPIFSLPPLSDVGGSIGVAFWMKLSTEWDGNLYANPAGIDRMTVSVVQGPVATEVWTSDAIEGTTAGDWVPVEISLEDWAEAPIQIRFAFATVDAVANDFQGPIIDELKVGRICPLD